MNAVALKSSKRNISGSRCCIHLKYLSEHVESPKTSSAVSDFQRTVHHTPDEYHSFDVWNNICDLTCQNQTNVFKIRC